jgi:hypothetical protein
VTGGAVSLTGNAASTLATTSGALNLQGDGGVNVTTTNKAGAATNSISITSGNVTSGAFASGNVAIDVGTSTGSKGVVQIGINNASAITIGSSGITTTNQGSETINQNLTVSGTVNTNTFTSSALTFGNTGAAGNVDAANGQTLNLGTSATAHSTVLGSTGGSSTTTINAGSGGIILGSSTIQRSASSLTLDVANGASASTLTVTNSGAGLASLSVEGGVTIGASQVFAVGASTGSNTTCSGGNVLQNAVVTGGIITGGTCVANGGGVTTTLATAYTNGGSASDQTLALSAADGGGVLIKDASTTVGNLFTVQNNGGTSTYLNVTNAGIFSDIGLTLGKAGPSGIDGQITFNNSTNSNSLTLKAGATGTSGLTFTLPTADGLSNQCLETDGAGNFFFGQCSGNGGGGAGNANKQLSNLQSVAVNASLNPGTTNSINLGDSTHVWQTLYLGTGGISTAATTDLLLQPTTGLAKLNTASVNNEIQVFENAVSPTNYTSIKYGTISTSSGNLTLNAAGGTVIMGANTTTLQKSGTAFSFDLNNASNSTFTVTNGGAGIASLSVEGGVTIGSGQAITVGATAGLTADCSAGGQILSGIKVAGGVVTSGSCAANGSTPDFQTVYGASSDSNTTPQLTLNTTKHGLIIQDAASPLGSILFAVQSNGGANKYISVTSNGVDVAGNITATGTYNTNTFNSTTLTFGGAGAASIDAASGQNLNVGTGASNHTTAVGSTNGTSTTNIQSGSGGINLVGNVNVNGSNTFSSGTGAVTLQGATDITASTSFATRRNATTFTTAGTTVDAGLNVSSLYILDTSGAAQIIDSIVAGRDGQHLTLINADASLAVTIRDQVNATTATAANKITTGTGANVNIPAGGSISLIYDTSASRWRVIGDVAGGTGGGVTSIGSYTNCTAFANGAQISGGVLTLGCASTLQPGLIDTGAQTFAGAKTFNALLTGSAGLTVSGGAISLTGNAASTFTTANVGAGSSATITIGTGNVTAGGGASGNISIDVGTSTGTKGTVSIATANASTVSIGSTGSTFTAESNSTANLFNGNTAHTINLGAGATGTNTITIGSANSTSSVKIQSGTGNSLNLESQGTISIGNNAVAQNVVIGNGTGATSVAIQCGSASCGLGTNAVDHSTTVGSTTGTSLTTVQGGTGGVSVQAASTGTIIIGNTNNNNITLGGASSTTTAAGNVAVGKDVDITGSLATKKGTDYSTTGIQADINFGDVSLVRLTGVSAQTIAGIQNGRDGYRLTIINAGSTNAQINDNDTVNELTANRRIRTGTGGNISIAVNSSIELIYDSAAGFWRVVGDVAGGAGAGVTTIGTYTHCTSIANGAQISGNTITLGCADGTNPGLVDTQAQTFAGAKTFSNLITGNAGITTSGGAVNLQGNAASQLTTSSGNLTLSTTAASGQVIVDAGTAGNGTINIGTTNANVVNVGNSSANTSVNLTSGGTGNINLTTNGSSAGTIVKTATNSTTAFQVQNSSNTAVLAADTTNMRVGVDVTYTAMSAPTLNNPSLAAGGSLTSGATYRYEVTAIDGAGGETLPSVEKSAAPSAGNLSVSLTWGGSTGAIGYKVYRTAANGASGSEVLLVYTSGTSYTDTGSVTGGTATPPATSTAYSATNNSSNSLQLSVGGLGRPTGQLYVSGVLPATQIGSVASGGTTFTPGKVQGKYLYTAGGGKFFIYDVSVPSNMNLVSSTTIANLQSFDISGHYAYTYRRASGVSIYDISNPSSLTLVGTYSSSLGTCGGQDIVAKGRYVFVADCIGAGGSGETIDTIDISNPSTPVLISKISSGVGTTMNLVMNDRYLVVSNLGTTAGPTEIFDTTNPASLVRTVSTSTNVPETQGSAVEGKYLFLKQGNLGIGVRSYDISNPTNLSFLQTLNDNNNINGGQTVMFIQGRFLYVGDAYGVSDGLEIVDISNPANMVLVGKTTFSAQLLAVSGRYAYFVDSSNNLVSYDLGGAYIQQLEAGGITTDALGVNGNASFAQDVSLQGGLQVGQSAQISGNTGIGGGLNVQGSSVLGGGLNQLATPAAPTVTPQGTTGAQRWDYTITAVNAYGGETLASSAGTTATGNATLTGTNFNRVTWSAVSGATSYKIYRTFTTGATSPTTTGLVGSTTTLSFDDTGFAAVGSAPTVNTTGQLTVTGSANFQNATNSTTAFQIQNSSGTNLLNVDTTTNTVGINDGAGANNVVVNIGTGVTGSSNTSIVTIGSANSAASQTTILGGNGASAISLQAQGGAGIAIGTSNNNSITIGNNGSASGTITIGRSTTGSNSINIGSGNLTSATQTVNIANGTSTTSGGEVVNIANGVPGSGTTNTVNIGASGAATGTVGVTIGSIGAAAHTTTIQGGNGAGAISLLTAAGGTINIATGGATSANSGTISIKSGNITTSGTAGDVTIDNGSGSTAGTPTLHIGDANARTISIGNSNVSTAINVLGSTTINGSGSAFTAIGTGSSGTITIGSVLGTGAISLNSAQTVTLQATNGITLQNNVTASAKIDITGSLALKKGTDFAGTGAQNNVAFGSDASLIRLTGASAANISGIANGRDGFLLTLVNTSGSVTHTILNDSGLSSAGNKIYTGTGATLNLLPNATVQLIYDSTAQHWQVIGVSSAGGPATTLATAYTNGSSSTDQTILLASGDGGGIIVKDNAVSVGSAFQIQNAAGTALLNADTSNMSLTVGGNILPLTSPTLGSTSPNIATNVDGAGTANGTFSQMAIGNDGLPIIAFVDGTTNKIDVTKCGNETCSSGNTVTTALSSLATADFIGLAIPSDGKPIIAYHPTTTSGLRAIKCANTSCTSASSETVINATTTAGQNPGATIGSDGLPMLVGSNSTNNFLSFYHCSNISCTSSTSVTPSTVFSVPNATHYNSITIGGDGYPVVAASGSSAHLTIFHCNAFDCSGTIDQNELTTGAVSTGYTAIATAANGYPMIGFYDGNGGNMQFMQCTSYTCSTNNNTDILLDGVGVDLGEYASIALGSDNLPIMAYYDTNNGNNLHTLHCGNSTCTSGNVITTPETTNDVGKYTSIHVLPDGLPVTTSYQTTATADLHVVRCGSVDCSTSSTTWSGGINLGSSSSTFNTLYAATISTGSSGQPFSIMTGGSNRLTIDNSGNIALNGTVKAQPLTDSLTAFQVQNSGGAQLLNIDTTNPVTDLTNNLTNNIVTNGSGETGTTGWAAKGSASAPATDSVYSYIGNDSIKTTTTALANDGLKYNLTTTSLAANTTYNLTMMARLAPGNSMSTFNMGYNNGTSDTKCFTVDQNVSGSGWTKFSCTFTTSTVSGTPFIFAEQTDATVRTLYIDAVSLTKFSLLANPSIEQAIAGNWATLGSTTTFAQESTSATGPSYDGTKSLHIVTTAAAGVGAQQAITLSDNTTYQVTVYISNRGNAANLFTSADGLEIGYNNGSTNTVCATGLAPAKANYTGYTCRFTTPTSHSGSPFFYIKTTAATIHDFNVDYAQLTVDNPQTAYQEGQIAINGVVGSSLVLQNNMDSTAAFQVQNSLGTALLNVDSLNNNITLNALNPQLNPWQSTTNLPANNDSFSSVVVNGYVYIFGGSTGKTASYAKLNADGTIGTWQTANTMPGTGANWPDTEAVAANGYVYIMGGTDGTNTTNATYYAKVNNDGSLGAWQAGTPLPTQLYRFGSVVHNGYVYAIGGKGGAATTGSSTTQNKTYYAKLNADGSLGNWNTSAQLLNGGTGDADFRSVVVNDFVYVLSSDVLPNSYASSFNSNGDISGWSTITNPPQARYMYGAVVMNGFIYIVGGRESGFNNDTSAVWYTKPNLNGSVNSWSNLSASLPVARGFFRAVTYNGYIYALGGNTSNTAFYTSGSRVQVGGSLDLIGLAGLTSSDQGGDLSQGSLGGSLTAGNTLIAGNLQVQGQASFNQSVGVTGNLNVQSAAAITASADTNSAFLIGDKKGNSVINVSAVANGNLLNDGNFEGTASGNAYSGWSQNNGVETITTSTDAGHSVYGAQSLKVATTATGSLQGTVYKYYFKPNTTYTFSAYVSLAANGGTKYYFDAWVNNTPVTCTGNGGTNLTFTTTVTRYSCTFTTGSTIGSVNGNFVEVLRDSTDAVARTIYIDGAQLEYGSTATNYADPGNVLQNLVSNPSLEYGNTNGWSAVNAGTISLVDNATTAAQFGSTSLKLLTTISNLDAAKYIVPLSPTTQYTMTFWAKASSGTPSMMLGRQDVSGTNVDCSAAITLSTSWQQFICSFTTGATITPPSSIYLRNNSAAIQTVYIDGVTLTPGSAALTYTAPAENIDVNSYTNNIALNAGSNGEIQPWKLNPTTSTAAASNIRNCVQNGFAYQIDDAATNDYYRINTDGSWTRMGNVPDPDVLLGSMRCVSVNGYIYTLGGSGSNANTVYSAKPNPVDGSITSWTKLNPLPTASNLGRTGQVVTANGYIYMIGGDDGSAAQNTIYYAKANADGTVSAWTTSTVTLGATNGPGIDTRLMAVAVNGFLYVMGGDDGSTSKTTVSYIGLNKDGSLAGPNWSVGTALPAARSNAGAVFSNGYIYVVGGSSTPSTTAGVSTVWFAKQNADGSIGTWNTSANPLPATRNQSSVITSNGYIYLSNGRDSAGTSSTAIYYASTARTLIAGGLDLLGLNGQSLTADGDMSIGSMGGFLTAGNTQIVGTLQVQGQASFAQGLGVGGALSVNSTGTGTTAFSIDNATTGINQLQVKDLSQSFGSAVTAGAFIQRNSYFGEEFNSVRAGNCTDNTGTNFNHLQARGDQGNPATTCTANTGEISTSSVMANSLAADQCQYSSGSTTNGIENITASTTNVASHNVSCLEYLGTNANNTINPLFNTNNLPVIAMKWKSANTGSTQRNFIGISNIGTAKTAPVASDKGLFFSNCTVYGVSPTCGSTWCAAVFDGGNLPSCVSGTNATACPATDNQGSSPQTTNSMYGRIESTVAPSGTTVNITFYIDYDVSNGVNETKCGTVSTIATSGGLNSVGMSMMAMVASTPTTATATTTAMSVDYFRGWQDDNVASTDSSTTDTSSTGNSGTTATTTEAPVVVDPDQPDPNVAGSFFNFLGATSEDTVINGNLFVHGTIYADKIKANEIEGLSIFTDQLASLQQKLNEASSTSTNPNGATTTDTIIQTATTTLNLSDGLTVGGDANFHGNVFFYKLVTFTEKTLFNNDVTFAAHITTDGAAPTYNLEAGAGDSSATASIDGNDNSGNLSITAGGNTAAGKVISVTFAKPYAKAPRVILSATNYQAAGAKYYVQSTASGFDIYVIDPLTGGANLQFNYFVIQ